jgi:hypothetical protein
VQPTGEATRRPARRCAFLEDGRADGRRLTVRRRRQQSADYSWICSASGHGRNRPGFTLTDTSSAFEVRVGKQQPVWCILQFSKIEDNNLNAYRARPPILSHVFAMKPDAKLRIFAQT